MKAILNSIRITSKKINLIADLVRNKSVNEALDILKFTPKKGAKILHKVVKSAAANAENNFKQDLPTLFIQEIVVTEGPTLKRGVPVSRGRIYPILKRTAHVSVFLGVKADADVSSGKSTPAKTREGTGAKNEVAKAKKTTTKVTPKTTKNATKTGKQEKNEKPARKTPNKKKAS